MFFLFINFFWQIMQISYVMISLGDNMKKNFFLILFSIILGIAFTFFVLNKENIYAKGNYQVYAILIGTYASFDEGKKVMEKLPSSILVENADGYSIYGAIYKDADIINKMVLYFTKKNIDVYLININTSKDFYQKLDNFEKLVTKCEEEIIYDKINQSILKLYGEEINHV